ncbi:nitroreductase family protein [Chloroflexota bacterium]
MIRDLILTSRTRRRFYQDVTIGEETLRDLIDLARCSPSGSNKQPLKYIISCDAEKNTKIFPQLGWAGALKDWLGPLEGERPSAYIIILLDTEINESAGCDQGIAAQSILLGANEMGLGGCMHGSAKKEALSEALGIAPRYEIQLVLSLGKPKEEVVLETMGPDGNVDYWRDTNSVHHVPKRSLDDIIID